MKTLGLIGIVVALHCVVIGSVFFISGCGTASRHEAAPETPVMPSTKPPAPEMTPSTGAPIEPMPLKEVKTAGGGEYIVQPGDSLAVIAKRCHVSQAELIGANKIADPNKVRIGQKLILPASGQLPAPMPKSVEKEKPKAKAAKAKTSAVEPINLGANEYVVKPGDSLSRIGARCGVKISALREANKLQSDKLKIGQRLAIPEADKAAPVESAKPAAPAAEPAAATPAVGPAPAPLMEAPAAATPAPATASTPVTPVKGTELTPVGGPAKSSLASSGISHTVQKDEDLNSIAKLYAVTADEIAELNQLSANRTVQVGQSLKIP
jgi:LysM repeat protein